MLTTEQIYVGALIRFADRNNVLYYNKLAVITAIHEDSSYGSGSAAVNTFTISIKFHGIGSTFSYENPTYYEAVDP